MGLMRRFELTDAQWEQIAPLRPPQKPRTGRPAEDHRQVLNGMLWIEAHGRTLGGSTGALVLWERCRAGSTGGARPACLT